MSRIIKMEVYTGAYMPIDRVIERIQQVTAQDIFCVTNQVLRPENRYMVAIQPET